MGQHVVILTLLFIITMLVCLNIYDILRKRGNTGEEKKWIDKPSSFIPIKVDKNEPIIPPRLSPGSIGNKSLVVESIENCEPAKACAPGLILPVWEPQENIKWRTRIFRASIYLTCLAYLFLGVSIGADRFMASIEVITSHELEVKVKKANGGTSKVLVRIWDETVSNLTLMALGSASPEILLTIIEIFGNNFEAGELGPGTIIGSAAFNFYVITAICMVVIPAGEIRKIDRIGVFWVTALWATFAYIWLYSILCIFSPEVVEVWEAGLTFSFFILTVFTAYLTSKYEPSFGTKVFSRYKFSFFSKKHERNINNSAFMLLKASQQLFPFIAGQYQPLTIDMHMNGDVHGHSKVQFEENNEKRALLSNNMTRESGDSKNIQMKKRFQQLPLRLTTPSTSRSQKEELYRQNIGEIQRKAEEICVKIDPSDGHKIVISIFAKDKTPMTTPKQTPVHTARNSFIDENEVENNPNAYKNFNGGIIDNDDWMMEKVGDKEDRPMLEQPITAEEVDAEGRTLGGKRSIRRRKSIF